MGYGAHMTVANNSKVAVRTFVTDVTCMYENGDDGSHLEYFNNLELAVGATYPVEGSDVYIEADGSGKCFFKASVFSLLVVNDGDSSEIGTITFTESNNSWTQTGNTNSSALYAVITNGDEGTINLTVAPT